MGFAVHLAKGENVDHLDQLEQVEKEVYLVREAVMVPLAALESVENPDHKVLQDPLVQQVKADQEESKEPVERQVKLVDLVRQELLGYQVNEDGMGSQDPQGNLDHLVLQDLQVQQEELVLLVRLDQEEKLENKEKLASLDVLVKPVSASFFY